MEECHHPPACPHPYILIDVLPAAQQREQYKFEADDRTYLAHLTVISRRCMLHGSDQHTLIPFVVEDGGSRTGLQADACI